MRLTELSLEKYGCYPQRTITIPEGVGLTVVYGPNEAGKSTYLEAIIDFLFGIAGQSARGETYGYPGMRIGASMRLSNGEVLALRRRKGHGKTLADGNGVAHDNSLLSSTVLGAINKDRFQSLFGLNHATLRSGGEDLLAANGEIGQLIVEAGGGLRAMVRRLEAVDVEAESLFSKTRNQNKKFYQALSVYETAESQAKAHLLSRDTYEEARSKADGAKAAAESLRSERVSLGVSKARLDRVLRVGPILRERDQLVSECEAFTDTADYPEEFSTKVANGAKARANAIKARDEAVDRRDKLKGKIDSLSVSANLTAAEKVITLLSEQAVKVSGARESRSNRLRDIDIEEAKLHPLRGMLGLAPDADLAGILPGRAAIDRVQALAAAALKRGSTLETAEDRVTELADALSVIEARITDDRARGHDRPLGVASSQFGSLIVQKASLDKRRGNAEREKRKIEEDVDWFGVASIDALAMLSCPAADDVRSEQTARETIRTNRVEQERLKRKAEDEIAAGLQAIADLEASGPIATVAAIVEARETRDGLWQPIRTAFIDGLVAESPEARRKAAEAFEVGIGQADGLSDRRADEAERVASRMELERSVARARRNAAEAEREITETAKQLASREEAFASAYPDVSMRFPVLPGLVEFSTRRKDFLDRVKDARIEAADIGVKTNELAPVVELMERMETKFGLDTAAPFAKRVEAVQAAITKHEQRSAGHTRDLAARKETEAKLKTATMGRKTLRSDQEAWEKDWPDAIRSLGGSAAMLPSEGNKLATEWRAAEGILSTINQITRRMERMDEDDINLLKRVSETARELGIDVAEDAVAGAQMLQKRWTENESVRVKRDGLKDEYEEIRVEAGIAEDAVKDAEEALTALASAIGVETDGLSAAAARFDARLGIEGQIAGTERRAKDAGDRLPVATLVDEWANLDLDVVRAELEAAEARSKQIDSDLEAAILKEKEGLDALAVFASESEVNRAIVERESATAWMHAALERYLELAIASDLLGEAMAQVRADQQDPLVSRAGKLFAAMTEGEFVGIETDVDDKGLPVVKGKRANGEPESIAKLSDGTRDQLFLAFRLASLESYGESAEPLPFIADDILVHFDDDRARATLDLLAAFGERNQMLLFTHHQSVRDAALLLAQGGRATIVDLAKAA